MQSRLDPAETHLQTHTLSTEQATVLAQLAHAVLHDGANLMIYAQDSSSSKCAGAALDAWWHAMAPHVEVTHFSGQEPLIWIGHINQRVSQQGLNLAMQIPTIRAMKSR